MTLRHGGDRWFALEAQAHLPEVQETIRQAIIQGAIRVYPAPNGRLQIVPMREPAGPARSLSGSGAGPIF